MGICRRPSAKDCKISIRVPSDREFSLTSLLQLRSRFTLFRSGAETKCREAWCENRTSRTSKNWWIDTAIRQVQLSIGGLIVNAVRMPCDGMLSQADTIQMPGSKVGLQRSVRLGPRKNPARLV